MIRRNGLLLFTLKEERLTLYRVMPGQQVLLFDAEHTEFFIYRLNPAMQGVGIVIRKQPYEFVAARVDNRGRPLTDPVEVEELCQSTQEPG